MVDLQLTFAITLAVTLGTILLLWGQHFVSCRHRASKSGARVPRGSFGWPIFGETISFARNPETYADSHVKRYGKLFKTSLFLGPAIVGTTSDFAKLITSNSKVFVSGWPANLKEVVGPKALMFQNGAEHMSIKKIMQKCIVPEALRTKVTTLETIVLENLASWEQKGTIIGRDGTMKISMDIGIWLLLGIRDICSTQEGKAASKCLSTVNKALGSVPLNLPGTTFNKALKAKAVLTKYLEYLIQQRQGQENTQADMLGILLAAKDDPQARQEVKDLDDEMIVDNLQHYWFAAYETTSTSLTWIMKILVDYPDIFRRVQAEQQEILKGKGPSAGSPRLSWDDIRKMAYTLKFYLEVQRFVSIVPVVIRMANQDVEYEGQLIPKGWRVCSLLKSIHLDPTFFPDPTAFNPDRFDGPPSKPYTYMPFSAGPHICPGMEAAKLTSLIFIHHITTTYTYESAEPDKGTEFNSFIIPKGGYPIHVRQRN